MTKKDREKGYNKLSNSYTQLTNIKVITTQWYHLGNFHNNSIKGDKTSNKIDPKTKANNQPEEMLIPDLLFQTTFWYIKQNREL